MAADDSDVLSGMPSRHIPWWQVATPQATRALDAANFRRSAEAGVFLADNDPTVPGTFGDVVAGRAGEQGPTFPRRTSR